MAAADGQTSPKSSNEKSLEQKPSQEKASSEKATSGQAWHDIVLQTLKRNDIRLVPYVPDRVLTRLIQDLHADPFFTTFPTAREEEAVGIVSGAWMGGLKGAVLMQTSGFATLANVLASLAMEHHTVTRLDEFEFIADRSIKQAITTQAPVALILSPLLTGGKVFDK